MQGLVAWKETNWVPRSPVSAAVRVLTPLVEVSRARILTFRTMTFQRDGGGGRLEVGGGPLWVDDAGLFIYLRLSGREHPELSQTVTHHDWTRRRCHDQRQGCFGRTGYWVRRSHSDRELFGGRIQITVGWRRGIRRSRELILCSFPDDGCERFTGEMGVDGGEN